MVLSKSDAEQMIQAAGEVVAATSDYPNMRLPSGVNNRRQQIMTWRIPNGTLIQMYINPQSFQVAENKQITTTKTKGGFVIQYWGDNLTKLSIQGTTGSSGVKGIQVLRDIYHSENRAFELIAASQANELSNTSNYTPALTGNFNVNLLDSTAKTLRERNFIIRPTLGSLAVGVSLFYQGAQYKGFFSDFVMTESVEKLGLFDYNISFVATEIRGRRENFMAWHREPIADDAEGQLLNAFVSKAGNALRGLIGMNPQQTVPTEFHPENAPLSFGGSSVASQFGLEATGLFGPARKR